MPGAWRLPRDPQEDINNLEKSKAVQKFSGDIRDYIQWRDAFKETIHFKVKESATRKVVALMNALPDDVGQNVSRGLPYSARGYAQRLERLERLFGNRNDLYKVVWTNLLQCPFIANLRSEETLTEFVKGFDEFKSNANLIGFTFDDRMVYTQISEKFSEGVILSFQKDCVQMGREASASNLRDWVEEARLNVRSLIHRNAKGKPDRKTNAVPTFAKVLVNTSPEGRECSFCSSKEHMIDRCAEFARQSAVERLKHMRDKKLCYTCLRDGHMASKCPNPRKCNCGKKHHPKLHREESGRVTNVKAFVAYGCDVPYEEAEGSEDSHFEDALPLEDTSPVTGGSDEDRL